MTRLQRPNLRRSTMRSTQPEISRNQLSQSLWDPIGPSLPHVVVKNPYAVVVVSAVAATVVVVVVVVIFFGCHLMSIIRSVTSIAPPPISSGVPRVETCILCQEDQEVTSSSICHTSSSSQPSGRSGIVVMAAFAQRSNVLASNALPPSLVVRFVTGCMGD